MLVEISKVKGSQELYSGLETVLNSTSEFTESQKYLIEQTELFCKEKALFNALRESVLIVDGQSKTKTPEAIPSILQAALSICFDTSVGHNYIDDAMSRYEYYHRTESRVRTGIKMYDQITKGGFPKKTLNVVLAPPHGGKSCVLVNIGAGAVKRGSNVLYVTMEMAAEEIGKRFDTNLMDIDFDTLALLPKSTFTSKFAALTQKSLGKLVIKEFATGTASAAHFRALLAELKTKQNFIPDMIIVDYMNICASEHFKTGSIHNSYTVVGSIGKELRALAIEADAALVTATQTNRSGVNNSDVDMTSVSDSASTSMIADFMMAIISTDELKQLKQILHRQLKNRYGGIEVFEKFILGVDYSKQQIYDLDTPAAIPEKQKQSKLNNKAAGVSDNQSLDILHQIAPKTASFQDFNFD